MFKTFNPKKYNLVVGVIFTATSIAGTILTKFQGWFNPLPAWAILFIAIAFIIAGVIISRVDLSGNPAIQVAAFGVAASPLSMLFAAFLGKMFPNVEWKTYSTKEIQRLAELGKLVKDDPRPDMTYGLVDLVLVAALVCTIAFAIFTVMSFLLPNWLYRFKTASIFAAIAYVLAWVIAVAFTTGRMINVWVFVFSIPPFIIPILAWSYQTAAPLTFERACATPISTFSTIVDLAQSVNDDPPPSGGSSNRGGSNDSNVDDDNNDDDDSDNDNTANISLNAAQTSMRATMQNMATALALSRLR